jgi:hypothetical protein
MVCQRGTVQRRPIGWMLLVFFVLTLAHVPQALSAPPKSIATAHSYFVYVGTYTGPTSKGIYAFRFDPSNAQMTPIGVAAEVQNPSFVVTDPSHRYLYAVLLAVIP